jgi:hypothetical protein
MPIQYTQGKALVMNRMYDSIFNDKVLQNRPKLGFLDLKRNNMATLSQSPTLIHFQPMYVAFLVSAEVQKKV